MIRIIPGVSVLHKFGVFAKIRVLSVGFSKQLASQTLVDGLTNVSKWIIHCLSVVGKLFSTQKLATLINVPAKSEACCSGRF